MSEGARAVRLVWTLAIASITLAGATPLTFAAPTEASSEVRAQVDAGQRLFVTSCASCHGATGNGALAPALAHRDLSLESIRSTIANGRTGTPMPPFKDAFDPKTLAELAAYVLSVASDGKRPTELVPVLAREASAVSKTEPVAIGSESGVPASGAALFFEPTRIDTCRACHSIDNKGGPLGPDLATLRKTPVDVLEALTSPKVSSAAFPAIAIRLKDGSQLTAVKDSETAEALVFYDVSSIPPVKRTVPRTEIESVEPVTSTGVFDHPKLRFSRRELLDLSAFVGTAAAR